MSKMMHRQFNTDNGEVVIVKSRYKACDVNGDEHVLRTRLSRKARKKIQRLGHEAERFKQNFAKKSRLHSPTAIACDAVELEGWFPHSMGGTNGDPRIDGRISKRQERGI